MMVINFVKKCRCKKGAAITIEFLIAFVFLVGIIFIGLEATRIQARISDLQQIANLMASEIEQTGKVDSDTLAYLETLSKTFSMEVSMDVDGQFIGDKLALETPFTVSISYNDTMNFGINATSKEKTYVAKGVGIAEKYHK